MPVAGTWYYADLLIPWTVTLTGIIAAVDTTFNGTDKWMTAIWPAAGGTALANSATAGTTTPGASQNFKIPFTAPVTLPGPAVYKVGVQSNGTGADIEVFGNVNEGFVTGSATGTFGTVLSLSPGSTYVQNAGPMVKTY